MIIGTIASILSGITFPLFLMFFGQITDLLTDKSTSESKGIQIGIKFIIIGAAYWLLSTLSNIQPLLPSIAGVIRGQLKA